MTIRSFRNAVLMFAMVFLAACAGGSKSQTLKGKGKDASSVCSGDFVTNGTITCATPSTYEPDCQCFVDVNTHEYFTECSDDSGQLSIVLPSQPVKGDLILRCGSDDAQVIAKNIETKPSQESEDTAVSGSPEAIPPAADSDTPDTAGVLCRSNDDCVVGTECRDGRCVSSLTPSPATPPPASPPAGPSGSSELQIVLEGSPVNHIFGLTKIDFQIQGSGALRAKYLYFPTTAADCEHGGLVTDQNGHSLRAGTPAHDEYHIYDTGTACTGDENCRDFGSLRDPATPLPVFCRVELQATSGTLYVKLPWPGKVSLAAQGENGDWQQSTHEFVTPRPEFQITNVTISDSEPKILINAEATQTAQRLTVSGCTVTNVIDSATPDGHASLTANCPFQPNASISIMAAGAGRPADNAMETYRIQCTGPRPSLRVGHDIYAPGARDAGSAPYCTVGTSSDRWWENCNGEVDLTFHAGISRVCSVTKLTTDAGAPEEARFVVPWAADLQVFAYDPDGRTECDHTDVLQITSASHGSLDVPARLKRNHACTKYGVVVHDLDEGRRTYRLLDKLSFPYKPSIHVQEGLPAASGSMGGANQQWGVGNEAWRNAFCQYDTPEQPCDDIWPGTSWCNTVSTPVQMRELSTPAPSNGRHEDSIAEASVPRAPWSQATIR